MNQFEYEACRGGARQLRRYTQRVPLLPLLLLLFARPASTALRVRSGPGAKLCGGKPCPYGDHTQSAVYATGETVEAGTVSGVTWEPVGNSGVSSSEPGFSYSGSAQAATPNTEGGLMDQFDDALKEPLATPCPVGSINVTTNATDAVNASTSNGSSIVVPSGTHG